MIACGSQAPSNRQTSAFAVPELTHIQRLPSVPASTWESMATPVVRSQTVSIGELLRSGSFVPARVQRAYCWSEEQQQSLMEDLLAAFAEFGLDPEPVVEAPPPVELVGENGAEQPIPLAEPDKEIEISAPFSFLGTLVLMPVV